MYQWVKNNEKIKDDPCAVADLAARGILKEGKLLNKDDEALKMADQLRKRNGYDQVLLCVGRLYEDESFLYKVIGEAMRHHDMSKVETLGPFCYLLHQFVCQNENLQLQILYRGVNLTDEIIEEYKQSVGKEITWTVFSCASKDRRVAEAFASNTLFIMSTKVPWKCCSNVTRISGYPDEQPVILDCGYKFKVNDVEYDKSSGKYVIYMTPTY